MTSPPTRTTSFVTADLEPTDIWRAADMMIRLYDQDAVARAAMRADALLEQGDIDGFFVWKRIARAIDDLHQMRRKRGEHLH